VNELISIGLILLLALLAGHLVKVLRIPEVTGYILAGVALGPSLLGWLSQDNLATLGVLSEVALGLILFSVGSVFEFSLFRRIGRQVLLVTLVESTLAAVAVTGGALWLGQSWSVALLLGAIATATAPASTLMVIRECDSAGPLTDNLLGIIAVNNLLCITVYGVVAAGIDVTVGLEGLTVFDTIYRSVFWFVWQLVGSAALGYLVGLLLAGWSSQVTESGEMLILLAGSILLCVGASRALNLSPLVTSLAVGATMVNLANRSRHLFETLSNTDPPFYAMFFVIAGAELDVSRIPEMGMLGLVYVVGRASGKFLGAAVATRRLGLEPKVRTFLGFALQAQAGLAVGLTLAVNGRYPDLAPVVTTVVLASVAVFEMIGPTSTRFALVQAGEAGVARRPQTDALTVEL
jgi:Kef-type K+ transport system membrane component KefB